MRENATVSARRDRELADRLQPFSSHGTLVANTTMSGPAIARSAPSSVRVTQGMVEP